MGHLSLWQRILAVGFLLVTTGYTEESERLSAQDYVGQLLITEVYYDTPGTDEDEEWIELANIREAAVDLTGFSIGDEESRGGGEGMVQFPDGFEIEGGQVIVIAQTTTGFGALFGRPPNLELRDSDPSVDDMRALTTWASGNVGLANDGDEVLLFDGEGQLIDAVVYGDSPWSQQGAFEPPSVADVFRGQSLERIPANCDTNTAIEWRPQRTPSPGVISNEGECRMPADLQADKLLAIGLIQGKNDVAAYVNQIVRIRGIVTGEREEQNAQGTRFYSFFVQDVPGQEDGDPVTSDGIAVFSGVRRLNVSTGDVVHVTGRVTEFFGLTEIDSEGLLLEVESRDNPLPVSVQLNPPDLNDDAHAYLEQFEGMLVSLPSVTVIGPTHVACGFAVVRQDQGVERVVLQQKDDPTGLIIGILDKTDVDCMGFPGVNTGDNVDGVRGPLTYHFDRFKIVQQDIAGLHVTHSPPLPVATPLASGPGQFSIATFNLDNYFDSVDDTGDDAEPKPSALELNAKQSKLAHTISEALGCPTLIGVQEVENRQLLEALAELLVESCGWQYQVSHTDGPDARGIDVALLTDPTRVEVNAVQPQQACTAVTTEVVDETIGCPADQYPLFSRPPLQVEVGVDGRKYTMWINHFKSKREGEAETVQQRLAQAEHLKALIGQELERRPETGMVVLGDFNDYIGSAVMATLTESDQLHDTLARLPREERYSYIFDGASQLVDWIVVSTSLLDDIVAVTIQHVNADYGIAMSQDVSAEGLPFRSSDHDIPLLVLQAVQDAPSPTVETPMVSPTAPVPTETSSPTVAAPTEVATKIAATASLPSPEPLSSEPTTDNVPYWLLGIAAIVVVTTAAVVLFKRR